MDLSSLPSVPPDAGASERIRQRCHAALTAQPKREPRGNGWWFVAAAAYLLAAIHQALMFLS
jgi:hypothetical protein